MKITEIRLKIYDRLLATISALAIVIGGFWSLNGLQKEKVKENELRKQQIELSIYLDKKATYYELCEATAEISACNSYDEVVIAQKHFIELYLGKSHIIQSLDDSVAYQKVMFKFLLNEYLSEKEHTKTPYQYFAANALKLSTVCKKELNINQIYE